MKKLSILLFATAAVIIASCDKKGPEPNAKTAPDYRDTLTGQWSGKAWDAYTDENLSAHTWEGTDTISVTKVGNDSIRIKSKFMDYTMNISPSDTRQLVLEKEDSIAGDPRKEHHLSFQADTYPGPSLTLAVYHFKKGMIVKNSRIHFARRFAH